MRHWASNLWTVIKAGGRVGVGMGALEPAVACLVLFF